MISKIESDNDMAVSLMGFENRGHTKIHIFHSSWFYVISTKRQSPHEDFCDIVLNATLVGIM